MSAWIVNREHIDVMVRFGIARKASWSQRDEDGNVTGWATLTYENADEVGRLLWTENVCSVAYRYPQDDCSGRPGPISVDIDGEAIGYVYRDPGHTLTAGEAFKTIACFDYQSCEHPGWESSEAKRVCDALTQAAIELVPDDNCPWGWDADELKKRPRSLPVFRA